MTRLGLLDLSSERPAGEGFWREGGGGGTGGGIGAAGTGGRGAVSEGGGAVPVGGGGSRVFDNYKKDSVSEPARVVVSQSLPWEYRVVLRDDLFDSGPHAAHLQMNDRDMHQPEKVEGWAALQERSWPCQKFLEGEVADMAWNFLLARFRLLWVVPSKMT